MNRVESALTGFFASTNRILVDAAKLASVWCADGVVSVLAAQNMVGTLGFSRPVAILTGIALEGVGVVVSDCALKVHRYNQTRRSDEPPAMEALAWTVAGLQFAIGLVLISVNAVFVNQMVFGLLAIGILSATGTLAHMLADDVTVREGKRGAAKVEPQRAQVSHDEREDLAAFAPAVAQANKREAIRAYFLDNEHDTNVHAAQALGLDEKTVGYHRRKLVAAGEIPANGTGGR